MFNIVADPEEQFFQYMEHLDSIQHMFSSLLCSNSSLCFDSSRWRAASEAFICHSNQSSGCLVYTSSEQRPWLSQIPTPDEAWPLHPWVSRVSILLVHLCVIWVIQFSR